MQLESLYLLEIAEQCQRYDDMVKIFQGMKISESFSAQQRSLFSTTYKNILSSQRTAWRAVAAFESKLIQNKGDPSVVLTIKQYKSKLEKQIKGSCSDALKIAEKLIQVSKEGQLVFYYRMKGDYLRYLCQIAKQPELKQYQQKTILAYEQAEKVFHTTTLKKSDPLLLGVCLNLAVFYYEIVGDLKKAIQICEKGFNGASDKLNDIENEEFKDTTTIMQLMYDNLMQWKLEIKSQPL